MTFNWFKVQRKKRTTPQLKCCCLEQNELTMWIKSPNCAALRDLQLLLKEAWLTRCRSLHGACVCVCLSVRRSVCEYEKRRFRYSVCWASVIKRRELCVFHAALLSLQVGVKRVKREFRSRFLQHGADYYHKNVRWRRMYCSHLKHFGINSHALAERFK